ncbi:hypothetical protein TNCV_1625951 [Trichonephila clavipes]|nr:hypothetical protein TNCV_1625951 [Trichonephila clavipes]
MMDTNIDSEKELSLEQKLKLTKTKKIQQTKIQYRKQLLSKTIRREINFSEDEGFRGKYLEKLHHVLQTVPSTSAEAEREFSRAGNLCRKLRSKLNGSKYN